MGYKSGIETKMRIYHSAIKLFTINGYYRTTMRMIAADAEVNLGLCTYHFKTKDNIVKSFYQQYLLYLREYLEKNLAVDNLFQEFLYELALNYSLLFSSRLLLTLFLEGITVDDLSRIYPVSILKERLSERIPPAGSLDDSWYLMRSVVHSAASRAILRKWREKSLQRSTRELTIFLLQRFYAGFELSGKASDREISQALAWVASIDLENFEKQLIGHCLSTDLTDPVLI